MISYATRTSCLLKKPDVENLMRLYLKEFCQTILTCVYHRLNHCDVLLEPNFILTKFVQCCFEQSSEIIPLKQVHNKYIHIKGVYILIFYLDIYFHLVKFITKMLLALSVSGSLRWILLYINLYL